MLGQNREPNFDEYQSDLAEPYDGEDEEGVDGPRKPHVQLTGQNSNVFNLLSLVRAGAQARGDVRRGEGAGGEGVRSGQLRRGAAGNDGVLRCLVT
jgi:hypothetical protein